MSIAYNVKLSDIMFQVPHILLKAAYVMMSVLNT